MTNATPMPEGQADAVNQNEPGYRSLVGGLEAMPLPDGVEVSTVLGELPGIFVVDVVRNALLSCTVNPPSAPGDILTLLADHLTRGPVEDEPLMNDTSS